MRNQFSLKRLFIGFILILCTNIAYSQQYATIYLKNGDRITGTWLGADDTSARIEILNNQKLSIPLNDVNNIRFTDDLSLTPDALAEKYFRNGEALLELGLREEAKRKFQAAIEEFPKYADAHYKLGTLLQEEGNVDEALKYFGHVSTINPEAYNMADQFKQAGDAYLAVQEYHKAAQTYLLLFKHYPDHQDAEHAGYTAGFLLAEELEAVEEGLQVLQEARGRFPSSRYLEKASYHIGVLQTKIEEPQSVSKERLTINISQMRKLDEISIPTEEAKIVEDGTEPVYETRKPGIDHIFLNMLLTVVNYGLPFELERDELVIITKDYATVTPVDWHEQSGLVASRGYPISIKRQTKINLTIELPQREDEDLYGQITGIKVGDLGIFNTDALQSEGGHLGKAVTTLTEFIQNYPESEWLDDAYFARGNAYLQLKQNRDAIADFSQAIEITQDAKLKRAARKKRDESAWTIYTVSDRLPSNQIQAIALDGDTLWIGTPKGLAQVNVSMGAWQPITNVTGSLNTAFDDGINVRSLAVDEEELWIGTLNLGVIRYNKQTGIPDLYNTRSALLGTGGGLPHNQVNDIEIDGDEVWIGTFSGVVLYNRATDQWMVYNRENNGLPADDIVALAVTPKTVWIGTSESGIAFYDRELGQELDYWLEFGDDEGLYLKPGSSITSFDVRGNQLFFTWYDAQQNGYVEIDLEGFSIREKMTVTTGDIVPVANIYIAVSEAALWIAINDGVYLRHSQGWEPIGFPADRLGAATVNCVTLGEGVAWVGTSNGLGKIDRSPSISPEHESDIGHESGINQEPGIQ